MFATSKTKSKLAHHQPSTGLTKCLKFISLLIITTLILAILQIVLLTSNDGTLEKNRERRQPGQQKPVDVQVRKLVNLTTGASLIAPKRENDDNKQWKTLEDVDTILSPKIGKIRTVELFDLNKLTHPSVSKSILRIRRGLSTNTTSDQPLEPSASSSKNTVSDSAVELEQPSSDNPSPIESQIESPEELGNNVSGPEKTFFTYDNQALPEPLYRGEYGDEEKSTTSRETYDRDEPSLAELIAAGTAVGLQLSRLNAVDEHQPHSTLYKKVSGLYSSDRTRELDQPFKRENDAHLDISESIPESLESLVESKDGGESSFSHPNTENQPAASSLVREDSDNIASNLDEDVTQVNLKLQYKPTHSSDQSAPVRQESYGQEEPIYAGPVVGEVMLGKSHLVVPIHDSTTDLNTAAGHYYGKKKYKKIVKKKKKKKIIVKKKVKKVKKKVKKYKIKKYKVKKYKVKKYKKKPKKYYHHHHHGGHHGGHHDHGKYYMYAKVPKKKSWEFGFKKGNKKHWIERHEKGHKNKFKTKVKWYDAKSKGKGIHVWDYNHHDKKKKHYA